MSAQGMITPLLIAIPRLPEIGAADLAGGRATMRAIDLRLAEMHGCALCLNRARAAIVAGPGGLIGPARWLDLCAPCNGDLHRLAAHWPGDDVILARYEQLQAEGLIPA